MRRLVDRRAQCRHGLPRCAFRREYSHPEIVLDIEASSLSVGTSGSDLERAAPNVASARSLPALTCGSVADTDWVVTWALLPRMATIAGPPPLVGRCRRCNGPVAFSRYASGKCDAP